MSNHVYSPDGNWVCAVDAPDLEGLKTLNPYAGGGLFGQYKIMQKT